MSWGERHLSLSRLYVCGEGPGGEKGEMGIYVKRGGRERKEHKRGQYKKKIVIKICN